MLLLGRFSMALTLITVSCSTSPNTLNKTYQVHKNNFIIDGARRQLQNKIIQEDIERQANCSTPSATSCINGDVGLYLRTSWESEGSSEAVSSSALIFRKNPDNEELLTVSRPESIINASFIPNRPIKVVIHGGFLESRNNPIIVPLSGEILKKAGGMNLILVDYGTLDAKSCYIPYTTIPHLNTLLIAECIVQVIEAILIYRSDISIEQFHIIGFSLGAQISGQLTNFPGILNITYPRMTGIDPAGPGFIDLFSTPEYTLDVNDARFVDVIHTDIGVFGEVYPAGHVDFYVNSGIFQPGCPANDGFCNHVFSVLLYAESINEVITLPMEKCPYMETFYVEGECDEEEMVVFGDNASAETRGVYFLRTNRSAPYVGTRNLNQYELFQSYRNLSKVAAMEHLT